MYHFFSLHFFFQILGGGGGGLGCLGRPTPPPRGRAGSENDTLLPMTMTRAWLKFWSGPDWRSKVIILDSSHVTSKVYPPVALNQYKGVNRTHTHCVHMFQGPTDS